MKANISWITPILATGGDLSPHEDEAEAQIHDILASGVGSIIDLRIEASDEWVWEAAGVPYRNLGTNDAKGHKVPAELFDEVVRIAREDDKHGRKTLVHCHMGVNRGPSAAFAILLDRGVMPVHAYKEILKARPIVGLAYAKDALEAHIERIQKSHPFSPRAARTMLRELHDFEANHWTEERLAAVNHTIRTSHEDWNDARQRMADKLNEIRR